MLPSNITLYNFILSTFSLLFCCTFLFFMEVKIWDLSDIWKVCHWHPSKWLWPLHKGKKNCLDYRVHGIQSDRLGLTDPIMKNMHQVPRYRQNVSNFAGLVWKAYFRHIFGNIRYPLGILNWSIYLIKSNIKKKNFNKTIV